MQQITIIGLGHVGASLGLAIKRWIEEPGAGRDSFRVTGFDYDMGKQKAAEKLGAVHNTSWNLSRAVQDAAIVVLAVSPGEQRAVMQELGPLLPDNGILTDTGAHKQQGLQWAAETLPQHVSYIAGHPVLPTTSEDAPSADLFSGVTWGVFPHANARPDSTEVVVGLVQAVGAKPYFADAAEHDAQVVATSLLPALAAATMMHTVSISGGWRDLKGMATGDLAELTRLASVDPKYLSESVSFSPAEAVRWLDSYMARLGELRDLVKREDPEAGERVRQFFEDAYIARERWLNPTGESSTRHVERQRVGDHFNRLLLGRRRRKD